VQAAVETAIAFAILIAVVLRPLSMHEDEPDLAAK